MSSSVKVNLPILSQVKQKGVFRSDVERKKIVDYIVEDLKTNPKVCKGHLPSIERACDLIENAVKKKYGIDKFEVITEVFKTLFPDFHAQDIESLKSIVSVLLQSGKLIKTVSLRKKSFSYAKNVFVSNFLFREV